MKRLTEIYGISEGPFDDVQHQLNRSQSVLGGPTTAPSVRKHQDRARRHSPDTARAQSDLDSAQSVFANEAMDDEQIPVNFTAKELERIRGLVGEYVDDDMRNELLDKLDKAIDGASGRGSLFK